MERINNIKSYNKIYGAIGEKLACEFLVKQGYKVLEKNYKNFLGEIDLICLDNSTYVFVEVKFRNSTKFGLPREAINYKKQQTIKKVATFYLKSKKLYEKVLVRFDCLEVIGKDENDEIRINLIKNIF